MHVVNVLPVGGYCLGLQLHTPRKYAFALPVLEIVLLRDDNGSGRPKIRPTKKYSRVEFDTRTRW
jgi:hypothetical protein